MQIPRRRLRPNESGAIKRWACCNAIFGIPSAADLSAFD